MFPYMINAASATGGESKRGMEELIPGWIGFYLPTHMF